MKMEVFMRKLFMISFILILGLLPLACGMLDDDKDTDSDSTAWISSVNVG